MHEGETMDRNKRKTSVKKVKKRINKEETMDSE